MLISPERLQLLVEAGTAISSRCCGFADFFDVILQSTLHLLSCEAASLFLPQASTGCMECVHHSGIMTEEMVHIASWIAKNDQPVIINDSKDNDMLTGANGNVRNLLSVPMKDEVFFAGVIEGANKVGNENFTAEDMASLEILGRYAAIAIKKSLLFKHHNLSVTSPCFLSDEWNENHPFIAQNPAMLSLLENITSFSLSNSPVLIIGEIGSGKRMLARQIHLASSRKGHPLLLVRCDEADHTRLEQELFGIGGAFVCAMGGSVLLDDVGSLTFELQQKLLHVIEKKHFRVAGTDQVLPFDVRVIASTRKNLEDSVDRGLFLNSLYVRLNMLPLTILPLRERRDEIMALAELFLHSFERDCHKTFTGFSDASKIALCAYMWPGNIRELENTVQRACILGTPPVIHLNDLRLPNETNEAQRIEEIRNCAEDSALNSDRGLRKALNDFKREYLTRILQQTNWNQTKAARILKVQRTYVSKLINDLGIRR